MESNTMSDAAKDEMDFPTLGISLEGIDFFIAQNGGRENFTDKTTAQVSMEIVQPLTKRMHAATNSSTTTSSTHPSQVSSVNVHTDHTAAGYSYCNMLYEKEQHASSFHSSSADVSSRSAVVALPHIGKATHFVSHAWGYKFLDVIDALHDWSTTHHHQSQPQAQQPENTSVYFWFDLFSNNQHKTSDRAFAWWTNCFAVNVGNIGQLLLVLLWNDPKPLTRAWCVWEIYSTVMAKGNLEIIMPSSEREIFMTTLKTNFENIIQRLCTVDVEKAQAYYESDLQAILSTIRNGPHGAIETNKIVIAGLRTWMSRIAKEELSRIQQSTDDQISNEFASSSFPVAYIHLLWDMESRFTEALQVCRSIIYARLRFYTPAAPVNDTDHPVTGCKHSSATAVPPDQAYDLRSIDSIPEEQKDDHIIHCVLQTHHYRHPKVRNILLTYADCLKNVGKYNEAIEVFTASLDTLTAIMNTNKEQHPSSTVSVRHDSSSSESSLTLPGSEKNDNALLSTFNDIRLEYLLAKSNCAGVYLQMHRPHDANKFYQEVITGYSELPEYGPYSLLTIRAKLNRASILVQLGQYAEACTDFETVINHIKQDNTTYFGSYQQYHPELLSHTMSYAICLMKQAKWERATEMYKYTLEGQRRTFGNTHASIGTTLSNYGLMLVNMKRLDEAEPIIRESIMIHELRKGKLHRSTLIVKNTLGMLLSEREKIDEAIEVYQETADGFAKVCGENDYATLTVRANVGEMYFKKKQYAAAFEAHSTSLKGFIEVLGENHPDTLFSKGNVARCYLGLREFDKAEALIIPVLQDQIAMHGPGHNDTIESYTTAGRLRQKQKRYAEAAKFFYDALEAFKNQLGIIHSPLAIGLLGNWCNAMLEDDSEDSDDEGPEKHKLSTTSTKNVASVDKGNQYDLVLQEIEKCTVFAGQEGKIAEEDIRRMMEHRKKVTDGVPMDDATRSIEDYAKSIVVEGEDDALADTLKGLLRMYSEVLLSQRKEKL